MASRPLLSTFAHTINVLRSLRCKGFNAEQADHIVMAIEETAVTKFESQQQLSELKQPLTQQQQQLESDLKQLKVRMFGSS